jgi:predicted amidohydrolase
MRIAHCQIEVKPGEFEANLAKVIAGLERADRERAEIVSFPECCLTGYPDNAEVARRDAFAADSPTMMRVLDATSRFEATAIVGFNERRGQDLYNTAAVIHKGHLLGLYSKCSAYQPFHKQGREFPLFERSGVKFGVIICADGGYIEPARILALQGAQIVFAPHYNYINKEGLLGHFMHVRADHIARAVENRIYFVRGNNVSLGKDAGIEKYDGVGYGDSYIIDPLGEMFVRTRRHVEDFLLADLDLSLTRDAAWGVGKSLWSAREFGEILDSAIRKKTAPNNTKK